MDKPDNPKELPEHQSVEQSIDEKKAEELDAAMNAAITKLRELVAEVSPGTVKALEFRARAREIFVAHNLPYNDALVRLVGVDIDDLERVPSPAPLTVVNHSRPSDEVIEGADQTPMQKREAEAFTSATIATRALMERLAAEDPSFRPLVRRIIAARNISPTVYEGPLMRAVGLEPADLDKATTDHMIADSDEHTRLGLKRALGPEPTLPDKRPIFEDLFYPITKNGDSIMQQGLEHLYNARQLSRNRLAVMRKGVPHKPRPDKEGLVTQAHRQGRMHQQLAFVVEEALMTALHRIWELIKTGFGVVQNSLVLIFFSTYISLVIKGMKLAKGPKAAEAFRQSITLDGKHDLSPTNRFKKLISNLFTTDTFIPIEEVAIGESPHEPWFMDLPGEILIATQNLPLTRNRNKTFWAIAPASFTEAMHPDTVIHTFEDSVKDREINMQCKRIDLAIQRLSAYDIRSFLNAIRDCTDTSILEAEAIEEALSAAIDTPSVRTKRNRDAARTLKAELPEIAQAMADRNFELLQAKTFLRIYPDTIKVKNPKKIGVARPDDMLFDIEDEKFGGKNLDLDTFITRMKAIELRASSVGASVERAVAGMPEQQAIRIRVAIHNNDDKALKKVDEEQRGEAVYRTQIGQLKAFAAQFQIEKKK